MRSALFLTLCLALPAGAAEVAAAPELYTTDAQGTIDVAADGSVVAVDITTDLGDDIQAAIERRIGTWRFTPREHGAPVARGNLDLSLRALQSADKVDITVPWVHVADLPGDRVDGTVTTTGKGDAILDEQIKYPFKERSSRLGARLIAILRIGADGVPAGFTLEHAEVHDNRASPDAERHAKALERFTEAARTAAVKWRFPSIPEGERVRLPITFTLPAREGAWMRTYEMTVVSEPWGVDGARVSDLGAGGAPASQALRLETDPAAL